MFTTTSEGKGMGNGTRVLVVGGAATALLALGATAASAYGQCGPPVGSDAQLIAAWNHMHIIKSAHLASILQPAGYGKIDGPVARWLNERVLFGPIAAPATTHNNGCSTGVIFGAGLKTWPKNHVVAFALPNQLDKSDVSVKKTKTFSVGKTYTVDVVADSGCANPHSGHVKVTLYFRAKSKTEVKTVVTTTPVAPAAPVPAVSITQYNTCGTNVAVVGSGNTTTTTNTSTCTEATPIPTPTVTPTPTPTPVPPSIVQVTILNDVPAGQTSVAFCATAILPNRDSGTMFFLSKYGSFSPVSVSVIGTQQGCSSYTAPNDTSVSTDPVQVEVVDNTNGTQPVYSDVQYVPISSSGVRPALHAV